MENVLTAVPLVVFLPLLGATINLFFGKSLGEVGVGVVAIGASASAFVVALLLWAGLVANDYHPLVVNPPLLDSWIRIPSAGVDIPWQFRVDTLSVTMMLIVSGVGTLIHIYATGYMHGDSRFPRFFVYLNLFLVFMMTLVTGNNLLMMFVGWEGVGLCSFLLIGFWFDKPQVDEKGVSVGWKNSNAARKAFIANRVGDFGVLMAVFLTFWTFGTLDFYKPGELPIVSHGEVHAEEVHEAEASHDEAAVESVGAIGEEGTAEEAHSEGDTAAAADDHGEAAEHAAEGDHAITEMGIFNQAQTWFDEGGHTVDFSIVHLDFSTVITLITLFMLLGATGKSAQIPLFVWLPDAMAGPTPVSALIHAATMVTAGVYMMVRSNVFFYESDLTSFIVTLIGISTALMAGFIAIGQWDVKKVLAYSTVSQLGFMVAAVGIGAYGAAMFHLMTHAFFKALLFLGSGSIIHGMEHGHHHLHDHHGHDDDHAHDEHGHEMPEHTEHEPDHEGETGEDEFDPQDMRNMGGLRDRMPITFWTYLIGTLALAGVFPFAGFWSKDEIVADAFLVGWEDGDLRGFLALLILLAAAFMTAFYMWRQVRLVFYGEARHPAAKLAPESAWSMTIPLIILAFFSIMIGFVNLPSGVWLLRDIFGEHHFAEWLEHSVVHAHGGKFLWWLALGAVGLAVGAIMLAQQVYNDRAVSRIQQRDPLQRDPQTAEAFAAANAKLWWDETYYKYFENPYNRISRWMADKLDWEFWHDFVHERLLYATYRQAAQALNTNIDRGAIDLGILWGFGRSVNEFSKQLRRIQTGYVRTYALTVVFGTLLVMLVILIPVIRDLLGV